MCDTNENSEIKDSLNRMQIDQLHNAVLNFSNNSLETKKLCVATETASVTLLTGLLQHNQPDTLCNILCISSFLIALLFYIVDIFLYYYQDRLRDAMLQEENEIRRRHGIPERTSTRRATNGKKLFGNRMLRSCLNGSQIMYWILMFVSIVILVVPKLILQN